MHNLNHDRFKWSFQQAVVVRNYSPFIQRWGNLLCQSAWKTMETVDWRARKLDLNRQKKNPSKARVSGIRCNNKRKIFSFLTRPSWRRRSSAPTNTFVRANASIACCPLRQFRVCVVRLVLACTVHRGTTTSSKSQDSNVFGSHFYRILIPMSYFI